MRTNKLAVAAILAAAALSVNAQTRMESASGVFTYEVLGATPSLTFGRANTAVKAAEAPKPAAAAKAATAAPRATATATSAFTYDTLGATPHVEIKKQPAKSEVMTPAAAN
jgi:hypothetical protein